MAVVSKLYVSREDYLKLYSMSASERNDAVEELLNPSIICGYGYYGVKDMGVDSVGYYIRYKRGESCD